MAITNTRMYGMMVLFFFMFEPLVLGCRRHTVCYSLYVRLNPWNVPPLVEIAPRTSWAGLVYVCNWRFFLIILMRDVFYRFIYCFSSNYDFDTEREIYDGAACCDSFPVFTKGGKGGWGDGIRVTAACGCIVVVRPLRCCVYIFVSKSFQLALFYLTFVV